jgi:hypothetical protein
MGKIEFCFKESDGDALKEVLKLFLVVGLWNWEVFFVETGIEKLITKLWLFEFITPTEKNYIFYMN